MIGYFENDTAVVCIAVSKECLCNERGINSLHFTCILDDADIV